MTNTAVILYALSGGYRNANNGAFNNVGNNGNWWSATANGSEQAWYRNLWYNNENLNRNNNQRWYGFSVRCVQR